VLRALINALDNDRLHHAFLFSGTRGVGKTTIARLLAKSLNCERGVGSKPCGECDACREIDEGRFVDLIEVDAASRTKVEDTRELLDNVQYAPTRGRYKVYLVDEVHMLSNSSFNALLKTLEEPPPHVKFLLATTDPQKLPPTILSRCLQFNLKQLHPDQIVQHLDYLLQQEAVESEPAAVAELARAADGSMRDALSLLDQAIAYGGGRLVAADVRDMLGIIDRDRVFALLQGVAGGDSGALLAEVDSLAEQVPDYAAVLAELVSALHRVAVAQAVPEREDAQTADGAAVAKLAATLTPEDVQLFYQIGLMGRRDLPLAPDPRSGLEMVLLRMQAFRPAPPSGGGGRAPAAKRTAPPQEKPASRPTVSSAKREASAAAETKQETESTPVMAETTAPSNWSKLVEALPLAGMARQVALHCVLAHVDAGRYNLVLDADQAHLRNPKWEAVFSEALSRHLGRAVQVTIRCGEVTTETPAARCARETETRQREAEEALASDGQVQSLLERFDGEIEPGSVRPVE